MNAREMKKISRGIDRDMAPEAIARRLDIVSRLREFTRFLGSSTRIDPERDSQPLPPSDRSECITGQETAT